jgi:osmotically-inducible protein OsmY
MIKIFQSLFTNNILKTTLLMIALQLTSSCVPILVGAGGVAAIVGGKMMIQEKTVGETISDTTIWTKIKTKLANSGIDNLMMGSINIKVNEGRVLLTGTIPDKHKIITILKSCWSVNGVKEVINELKIAGAEDQPTFFNKTSDAWITSKIKGKLLADVKIHSIDYTVETIDGVVYLFGTSQSQSELDEAVKIASNTEGVKKVVSYVRIKKDVDKKIAETKGNKAVLPQDKDERLKDYDFSYSDESTEKAIVIKPEQIEPDVFEVDDF